MSLSKEEKKSLEQLSEYFRKIEKIAIENKIDLDVFMTEYNKDGISVYATEKVDINVNAEKRKSVFKKTGMEKAKSTVKNH